MDRAAPFFRFSSVCEPGIFLFSLFHNFVLAIFQRFLFFVLFYTFFHKFLPLFGYFIFSNIVLLDLKYGLKKARGMFGWELKVSLHKPDIILNIKYKNDTSFFF